MSSLPLAWRLGLEMWFPEENPFIAGVPPPPAMSTPFSRKFSASLIWLVLHPERFLYHLPLSAEGLLETVTGLKAFSKKLLPSPWFFPLLHFVAPLGHVPSWKIWLAAGWSRCETTPDCRDVRIAPKTWCCLDMGEEQEHRKKTLWALNGLQRWIVMWEWLDFSLKWLLPQKLVAHTFFETSFRHLLWFKPFDCHCAIQTLNRGR